MIRLCVNCDTENPVDAVMCLECGMSLTRAPTGESAPKARSMAVGSAVLNRDGQGSSVPIGMTLKSVN